jgi:ribosome recycling factor
MNNYEQRLKEVIEWLRAEYTTIRTGQATPGLLDGVKVESYGSLMNLNQVGSIGVEDARTLRVSPWDASQVSAVEKAIRDADLGVSVSTDSSGLRVIFPELTSERREQLSKLAKSKLEDARVTVRGIRDDVMKELDKANKDGDLSDDEKFGKKESVQKSIDSTNKQLEEVFIAKHNELEK